MKRKLFILIYCQLLCFGAVSAQATDAGVSTVKDSLERMQQAALDSIQRIKSAAAAGQAAGVAAGLAGDGGKKAEELIDPTATTEYDDLTDAEKPDANKVHHNWVKEENRGTFNALDYILDGRYMPSDEDKFSKTFLDNFWVEGGFSLEKLSTSSAQITFGPQAAFYVGAGKHLDERHALRAKFFTGYVYTNEKSWFAYRMGGKVDYLYDFSAHFAGSKTDRRWTFSSILGAGIHYTKFNDNYGRGQHYKSVGWDLHAGVQAKLYTGAHGCVALEPYVGLSSDVFTDNWKKFSFFYGANLSYIYYINDRLSKQKRKLLIDERDLIDEVAADSTLYSWRRPWFFEISTSFNMGGSAYRYGLTSNGFGWVISAGQWLSTALGVRGSLATENFSHNKVYVPQLDRTVYEGGNNFEGRIELLFNPFGMKKNYDWDSKYGLYIFGGMKFGRLWQGSEYSKYANDDSHYISPTYFGASFGAHGWLRLSDGMQAFIEPRYEYNDYHDKYFYQYGSVTDDRNKRFNSHLFTVQLGFTVTARSRKCVDWTKEDEKDYVDFMKKWTIGIGGGGNFLAYRYRFDAPIAFGYNGEGYAEYHFDGYHSVRANILWQRNPSMIYKYGTFFNCCHEDFKVSLSYMLNLTKAMARINPDGRKFEFFVFAGPTLSILCRDRKIYWNQLAVTFHIGAKLQYNIDEHWAIHLTPSFYYLTSKLKDPNNPGSVNFGLPTRVISAQQVLSAGAQFSF